LAAAAAAAAQSASADPLGAFTEYVTANKVAGKVKLAPTLTKGVQGMVATEEIKKGDTVLDIPFSMMLTLKSASAGPLARVISEKQMNPTVIMALHLMNERNNASSPYKAWLDVLPTAFETPMFWTDDDLAHLNGSSTLSVIKRRKDSVSKDYKTIFDVLFEEYPELFSKEVYTLESFTWAISTVWSRSFVFSIEDQLIPVIVPFADFLEHANVESTFALEEKESVFRISVNETYKPGERVYISLGAKPNNQLLMSHGMVLQQNPYDTVVVNMFLNEEDPFFDVKSKMLKAYGQPAETLYYLNLNQIPEKFLKTLRIQLLKPSELDDYTKIFDGKRVSLGNELDVLRQLVAACDTLLKQYPTTALEDKAALEDKEAMAKLSERAQTALVLRFGEKRVLHRTVELVSKLWSNLLVEGWSE